MIDLADEIAYNTADLDDGFSAGLFTGEDVAACVPRYAAIHEAMETQFPAATSRERFHEALRQLIDLLVSGLIEGTVARAREAAVRDVEEVRAAPPSPGRLHAGGCRNQPRLSSDSYIATVYVSRPTGGGSPTLDVHGGGALSVLSASTRTAFPSLTPSRPAAEPPHRVVCDYIAGMTDASFGRTFEATIVRPRSITLPRS